MMTDNKKRFTVIENTEINVHNNEENSSINFATNPMYQKLLNFRNLQEQQKKKFSVDDLFKLC